MRGASTCEKHRQPKFAVGLCPGPLRLVRLMSSSKHRPVALRARLELQSRSCRRGRYWHGNEFQQRRHLELSLQDGSTASWSNRSTPALHGPVSGSVPERLLLVASGRLLPAVLSLVPRSPRAKRQHRLLPPQPNRRLHRLATLQVEGGRESPGDLGPHPLSNRYLLSSQ